MPHESFEKALAIYKRRVQLWHAARVACPDYASFRENIDAIERAISRLLADEFEPPPH
jgi:hypothetical protein